MAFTHMHVFPKFFFHTVLDESGTSLVNNLYHGHSKQVGSFRLLSSGIPIPVGGLEEPPLQDVEWGHVWC